MTDPNLSDHADTNDARVIVWAIQDLTEAVQALTEQQRIANLIALAESGRATINGARQALSGLYTGSEEEGSALMALRPKIAQTLGVEINEN